MKKNGKLFVWRDFDNWKETFSELLYSIVPKKVIDKIIQNPPEYYFDNLL